MEEKNIKDTIRAKAAEAAEAAGAPAAARRARRRHGGGFVLRQRHGDGSRAVAGLPLCRRGQKPGGDSDHSEPLGVQRPDD